MMVGTIDGDANAGQRVNDKEELTATLRPSFLVPPERRAQ
jgi:hypothetical protein